MTIRAISKQLGLIGSEVLVFEYLASLYYYGQVWKGTMEKLGDETLAGSKQTVARIIEKLAKMGLVEKSGLTIRLIKQDVLALIGTKQSQNETDKFQNGTTQFQNETETQEKEKNKKNKENIKDITKDNKSESNSTLALYKTILGNGYLHPRMHLKNMTSYYDANGWKSNNKVAVLANWMRHEQQFGHKPQMSDQAAAFICDMVDALPDYQESFCDALEAVKIEGDKAVLYVPEARLQKLCKWLLAKEEELSPVMDRHRVGISLRPAA